MSSASAKGVAKVLEKLEKSVGEGNYYEAHQMYRTVANRYVKAQGYANAIELLHSGSILLLKHKQIGSGTDLALYMVEVYNLGKVKVSEQSRDRIFDLADLMDAETSQRKPFLQNAINWSANYGEYKNGDPLLQHYVGLMYWREKDYGTSESHLLVGTQESAEALGLALFEWSEQEPKHDKGAYLLRGVFQELAMRNLRDANTVFTTFVAQLPPAYVGAEKKSPDGKLTIKTFRSSLLNLAQMLLLACQTGNPTLYQQLAATYKPVLAIDENFGSLMVTVGELFFGVRAPKQTNMLADLMSSLFAGPPASSSPQIEARPRGGQQQPVIEEMD